MKILRITLNNIASLAGIHSIDFTREPLRSAGLYGISGATGAGKSSVLDALCLALFDATPRLNQVGKLEQTIDGENQKSPGTLLRRGTSSGFAEVAFVGVDHLKWTARWSIRRSHNKPDGNLQAAEMTLFRGNVLPGQAGPVEAGAKKTLVQKTIIDKIGLTFDQFTRAVLLAQNEFATFLKAGDRERAEILQALTGTEQFESISRAVFSRCSEEKKILEKLAGQLEGNAPLSVEERTEACAELDSATQRVCRTEAEQKARETHADWFKSQKTRQEEQTQAAERLRLANVARAASVSRELELEQTEVAIREASVLWQSQEAAAANAEAAGEAVDQATRLRETQRELFDQSLKCLHSAKKEVSRATADSIAIQPLLRSARQLDARLEPLRERADITGRSLEAAQKEFRTATTALVTATTRRDQLLREQQTLKKTRTKLDSFAPFVNEGSKWLHLLREVMSAVAESAAAATEFAELERRRTEHQKRLSAAQESTETTERLWKTAKQQLQGAEAAELEFDADELARQHHCCDQEFLLLTTLTQELEAHGQKRDESGALSAELVELESSQLADVATLKTLTDRQLPEAERDVELATSQLQLIQAAVDDHAKRLRTSLQDDLPCPVCGSTHHPFLQHLPDPESAGIQAARQHVVSLEQTRDLVKEKHQRHRLAIESRTNQIDKLRKQLGVLSDQLETTVFSNTESPAVRAVLVMPSRQRLQSARQQQVAAVASRDRLELRETAYRRAIEYARCCRKAEAAAQQECQVRWQEQTVCDRTLAEIDVQFAAAETTFRAVETRRRNAAIGLGDLWSGLPHAKRQFEIDAPGFCDTFEMSTTDYVRINEQLTVLGSTIETLGARIGPLEESAELARRNLTASEADLKVATEAQSELLQERKQLFDGRAADDVEDEMTARQKVVGDSVEKATTAYHQADKDRQAATQQMESAANSLTKADVALEGAKEQLSAWIRRFSIRCSREVTIGELKLMLGRDEEWIRTEREQLKQFSDEVTKAESALNVRTQQLKDHEQQRPTADNEETVTKSLEVLAHDLGAAKAAETKASAVLASDDQRHRQNAELSEQLTKQETIAGPWLRLNDLIGSREGDKFRMIAQRRTLDVLLNYANHQLGQLAARYRLERLPESLNLIVIDEHMGDERRSVHSLSGGESFLVSLALALGLASLTSRRMKIESLFIDEGFGSLDPDTLNTAMSALMHLEAQGRKVGVISHVTEMTDAIPVQVRVVKRRGGASKIVIPGAAADAIVSETNSGSSTESHDRATNDVSSIAGRIVYILKRERQAGKDKVSNRALRLELGCETREFRAAQELLRGQVSIEGRSLRLA
jgi:exonuclease SbcC